VDGFRQADLLDTSRAGIDLGDADPLSDLALGSSTLLGVWDTFPVFFGWCPADAPCPQAGSVTVQADDGTPPADILEPEGFVDGVWGDAGLLARSAANCPDLEQCAGYDLFWS